MGITVGIDCFMYWNAGTFDSPTLISMDGVKDTTLTIEVAKTDATARLSTWKRFAAGLKGGPIAFNLLADSDLAEYDVLRDAIVDSLILDLWLSDGDIEETGTEYWHADYLLFDWKRGEPLQDVATIDVEADLAYSENGPEIGTVS